MASNHLILCYPLLPTSVFFSIRVFSNQSVLCITWPKYWNFNFSLSPSKAYSVLISFKIDWFDLPAVQGTFGSVLQHHSSRHQFFGILPFFTVQLSKPYVTTGKNLALIIQTFVGRVMSLLFNTLFRFVIVCLPRSNCLLISWVQ